MYNKPQFLITLVVLFSVNLANAQSWVRSGTVPNNYADQLITGNPNYPNRTSNSDIPALVQASMNTVQEEAEQQDPEANKKHCEKKVQALADAVYDYKQCLADAAREASNRLTACPETQSITISIPEQGYQQSGGLNAAAVRILGIESGTITSITYTPESSCHIISDKQQEVDRLQCKANNSRVNAMFATCL